MSTNPKQNPVLTLAHTLLINQYIISLPRNFPSHSQCTVQCILSRQRSPISFLPCHFPAEQKQQQQAGRQTRTHAHTHTHGNDDGDETTQSVFGYDVDGGNRAGGGVGTYSRTITYVLSQAGRSLSNRLAERLAMLAQDESSRGMEESLDRKVEENRREEASWMR